MPSLVWAPRAIAALSFHDVAATGVTAASATVSWDPSEPAQGQVLYGTTPGGPYPYSSILEAGYLTHHSQALSGLAAGTTYYLVVWGRTADGRTGYGGEYAFATSAAAGAFDAGITYISDHAWPTGTGWTAGSEATILANIQALIASAGSGADATHRRRHLPAAGAVYPISNGIDLTGYDYLTFEGGGTEVDSGLYVTQGGVTRWQVTDTGHAGGATIRTSGSPGGSHRGSVFYTKHADGTRTCTDLRFHCLTGEGTGVPGSTVASTTAGDGGETQHFLCLMGVNGAWADHVIGDKVKGDGVFATDAGDGLAGSYLSQSIRITNSRLRRNGRMLVAMVGVNGLTIQRCLLEDGAYAAVDSEPDQLHQTNADLLVEGCTIADWGWDPSFYGSPLMLTASRAGITFAGYIRFRDNVLTGASKTTGRPSEWNSEVTMSPYTAYTKTASLLVEGNIRTANFHPGPSVYLSQNVGGTTITGNRFGRTSGAVYGGTPGGSVTATDNT